MMKIDGEKLSYILSTIDSQNSANLCVCVSKVADDFLSLPAFFLRRRGNPVALPVTERVVGIKMCPYYVETDRRC